jgi:NADH:ubiquinone oxidoreductase subunit E
VIVLGWLSDAAAGMVAAVLRLRRGLATEIRSIDSDIRRTPAGVLLVISCLALMLACTVAFGGLHP